jgi:hypothetical protein
VFTLFLIIPPAAIGQCYKPVKLPCPDAEAMTNGFCWSFRFSRAVRATGQCRVTGRLAWTRSQRTVAKFRAPAQRSAAAPLRSAGIDSGRLVSDPDSCTLRRPNSRALKAGRRVRPPELRSGIARSGPAGIYCSN